MKNYLQDLVWRFEKIKIEGFITIADAWRLKTIDAKSDGGRTDVFIHLVQVTSEKRCHVRKKMKSKLSNTLSSWWCYLKIGGRTQNTLHDKTSPMTNHFSLHNSYSALGDVI